MSDGTETAHTPALRDMAASIYIQLISEAVGFSDKGVNITTNPENIARTSYKLAEAFMKIENEKEAAFKPKSTALDVGQIDFGA